MPKQWREKVIILMLRLERNYDKKLGVKFLPTWLRMEKEESIEEKRDYLIKKKYPITVFTHEWAIMEDEQKIWSNFEQVFEGLNHIERKIRFF